MLHLTFPMLAVASLSLAATAGPEEPLAGPLGGPALGTGGPSFVNFESAHVHPLDLTPDGQTLLAVNTADNRLELFTVTDAGPVWAASIPVGLDPVSVRARTATEAWVVNHVSDSVSVVNLSEFNVVRTLKTADEPSDVVFDALGQAFVSCSQAQVLQVFSAANPTMPPSATIPIVGEDPRALAISPDGLTVYLAVFESGNNSTVLGGGASPGTIGFPPNVVNSGLTPYGGVNPPPNDGAGFRPPINPAVGSGLPVGMIVKKDAQGLWMDDNGGDWTNLVSGPQAAQSGRPVGWDLYDHDVAIIDAATHAVTYQTGLMNICMALCINPGTGDVTVVGTDAINEVRYEPVVNGRFLRVNSATFTPGSGSPAIEDLNPHLTYTDAIPFVPIPQAQRDLSIGDPRAIAWNAGGVSAYVAGMGSNNLVEIDATGARVGGSSPIDVGQGPTGVVINETLGQVYVLNRFDATISTVDRGSSAVIRTTAFYDPSPAAIVIGRKHLFDTHKTSGLGHVSCASCHVDARTDRLAWDLGDPSGDMKTFQGNCLDNGCQDWHPMKGPMTTQTLQDIIAHEPHHWRSDRTGIEEFNGAFESLLGDDTQLTAQEMQEFEDYLATIHFPPNPFRDMFNGLPTNLPLPGHFTTGRFAPAGQPLPNGSAVRGLNFYRTANLDVLECVTCHTLPTGMGPDGVLTPQGFTPIPPGPDGEHHLASVSLDGSTNISIKIPQLRNMYDKAGFNMTQQRNTAGFGYLHDGTVDSIERFLSEPAFSVTSDQQVADLTAFMLAFSGSDLPQGNPNNPLEPPGPPSQDAHAAVGMQATLAGPDLIAEVLIDNLLMLGDLGEIGVVAKGEYNGEVRGFVYIGSGQFQSDRMNEVVTNAQLKAAAGVGSEITWTGVPLGTHERIGVDRDQDGWLDRDELDVCSDPADPTLVPGGPGVPDLNGDLMVNGVDVGLFLNAYANGQPLADFDGTGTINGIDVGLFLSLYSQCRS